MKLVEEAQMKILAEEAQMMNQVSEAPTMKLALVAGLTIPAPAGSSCI